ncbi:hypothetical protein [uncultured Fibrobacter sp.]|uniref:hypothetical protein n=1 Tax=uncultured Fibrobacter sp. TaxID=261512 RepID=UPI0026328EA3|nr:hypothetical protein [uncultured Fibrobacter sp.]
MQDTYVSEKNETGNFSQISYDAPPTNIFAYSDNNGAVGTFQAVTQAALDGCSGTWGVSSTFVATTGKLTHTPSLPDCGKKLTPNFENIGKGTGAAATTPSGD